ncbi:EVE domain-containing protein [bacterium (Candidatus Blackallbacteria) CG17_big_fil_post_rev_8_21_14_2_50_48_46]|uniref:EVE domain-containing protein n=1 Tax=bacterium (Candidatus Blackallbacteria) CG17_big_fil_post_rev_8_21_14_2_50_48_46 TaxID=2014261 RepID=A0A2M7G1H1_9BACT|nr:MAG: EVE domain-containing protein [bacterium (Candidatus Blackallbacteria) CG18_big_fil_WC_8_21_14_2_50_49_26]PIW15567.1 MAG: EVE domain-containing protein [bacterium (Candidatus Blackallbacteria) CG17_big_fil_post_rev_8_21_14_2_50_48_46]PIW49358.1 MAG: EVE domain-containing protein [bacterium (Candidatus Blackallbacteria) CG13_big_fil_rev_8_21_14_2_50_49_14]
MQYWLMKSEPEAFSIQDLKKNKTTGWDGVRNYQARNLMRDQMQIGDRVLFYHSNAEPPGVVGLAEVSKTGLVDPSQFDPASKYHDPKADPENPRWIMVEIAFLEQFKQIVSLPEMREMAELDGMMVLQKGARLSVQPVSEAHFKLICARAGSQIQKSQKTKK